MALAHCTRQLILQNNDASRIVNGPSLDHYRMICYDATINVRLAVHSLMLFEINSVRLREQPAE